MLHGEIKHFNIRVYGLVISNHNEVLLTDEFQLGRTMTKFPGGGLQFGEGTVECIKREAIEEFGQAVEVMEHFYTTDFFQKALFYEDQQLISIYYMVRFIEPIAFRISEKPFDFEKFENGNQSFRWKKICELTPDDLSFPIDKHVVSLLLQKYCPA
ncbi:MAG: NUDIX domain-containing protein [Bacteroidales bacterium]|nr:NUDIX domain-containing protein [Bacteroidales bacterium]